MSNTLHLSLIVLFLISITLWLGILLYPPNRLRIVACDVGQGDAILAIYGTNQILFDGGKPNGNALSCLSRYMPFWDRRIEVIVLSHPQLDHFGGLIEIVKRHDVDLFVGASLDSSSQDYQVLKSLVGGKDIRVVNAVQGQKIRMGLISLDIVWPTKDFLVKNSLTRSNEKETKDLDLNANSQNEGVLGTTTTSLDPNDFSIVGVLRYGEFDGLFTGDIGPAISDKIAEILKKTEKDPIEYLKVPHHGSKNGLSKNLLESTHFETAVISAGKNNSYGHPHKEILKLLEGEGLNILRTDEIGDVVVTVK